ncbi:MAG: HEAT repeat domain-containing protein [Chthonomonadales bacterium]|nr:HEAT repeat domain-containing protein [Chthonomonadales bacterium]
MNRKYINYAIFIAIVGLVVGLAINHSRHMAYVVSSMAGPDRVARIAAAKELVRGEQFMDSITGEETPTRVRIVQALVDWAASGEANGPDPSDPKKTFGPKSAVTQMVAYLKDTDKPVRDALLVGLIQVGTLTPENLQELVNGIKDGDGNARKVCITVLQALGQKDPATGLALLKATLPDYDQAALESAMARRKPEVAEQIIPKVVALMKADAAARGTGGDVLAAFEDQRERSVAELAPLLKDADVGVRSGAVNALGKVGSKTPVPQLVQMMHKDTAQVRRVAIGAIALIADRSGEAALTEALNRPDDNNEARAQAATGLGRIATPTAIATLVKALQDDDLKVQTAAVNALARAGQPAVRPLLVALRAPDPRLRVRAAQALEGIASPASNAALSAALNDPVREVRVAAAHAMGFEGNAGAVPALVARLANPDGSLAAAASEALATIGAPARPALAKALSGEATRAYFAAQALGRQGAAAVSTARQAASAEPAAGRWAAIALTSIGGPEATTALQDLARSGTGETRAAAELGLKKLGVDHVAASGS